MKAKKENYQSLKKKKKKTSLRFRLLRRRTKGNRDASNRGLSCLYGEFLCDALILKWVEAQVWRQCLHSVSHIVSEQQQQQQRWNSPWSSLSAASPSITDTVSLFLMVFGDFDRLLPCPVGGFDRSACMVKRSLLFAEWPKRWSGDHQESLSLWHDVMTAGVFSHR